MFRPPLFLSLRGVLFACRSPSQSPPLPPRAGRHRGEGPCPIPPPPPLPAAPPHSRGGHKHSLIKEHNRPTQGNPSSWVFRPPLLPSQATNQPFGVGLASPRAGCSLKPALRGSPPLCWPAGGFSVCLPLSWGGAVAAWAGCCESPPPAAARPSASLRVVSPSVSLCLGVGRWPRGRAAVKARPLRPRAPLLACGLLRRLSSSSCPDRHPFLGRSAGCSRLRVPPSG